MKVGVVFAVPDDGLSSKTRPFGTIRALSTASVPLVGRLGMDRVRHEFGGKKEVWEGLCGTCEQWIILTASKSGGVSWFRHAYKVNSLGWIS